MKENKSVLWKFIKLVIFMVAFVKLWPVTCESEGYTFFGYVLGNTMMACLIWCAVSFVTWLFMHTGSLIFTGLGFVTGIFLLGLCIEKAEPIVDALPEMLAVTIITLPIYK